MKVLVCGGRSFRRDRLLQAVLSTISPRPSLVIHGGARGADTLAGHWARANSVPTLVFEPDWATHGSSAGYMRNAEMLRADPDLVVAFPGGRGTAHMASIAEKAGTPVARIFDAARRGSSQIPGYEVSSRGDRRFSALHARMPDGRTVEEHYQSGVKGWSSYLALWVTWAEQNPDLMDQLYRRASDAGQLLTDRVATTPINQARALATILNRQEVSDVFPRTP